jgi:hypothetical protein
MSTLDSLTLVRYYVENDPYHYTTDNRPLADLDDNIRLVAEGLDSQTGSSKRAALAATLNGYAKLGGRGVLGSHITYSNSLLLDLSFSYGIFLLTETIESISTSVPLMAVHDKTTRFTNIAPAANAGNAVKYLVQATYREPISTDRVASGDSMIKVLTFSIKNSNEYPMSGAAPSISPDVGRIPVMEIIVPYGTTTLNNAIISYLEYKTLQQASNISATTRIDYVHYTTSLTTGQSLIPLSGTSIDTSNIDAVEVFLDGVNQFDWTWNSGTNNIVLSSAVTSATSARVRQAVVYQI